jgi:hypothetical protein
LSEKSVKSVMDIKDLFRRFWRESIPRDSLIQLRGGAALLMPGTATQTLRKGH